MLASFLSKPNEKQTLSAFKTNDTKSFLLQTLQTKDTLHLLAIIFLLFSVITLEFSIGLFLGGFHLMVDGLHNILNVIALGFSLIATIIARMPKNQRFTYGYSRLEIISSFTNCCFLVFLSLFLVFRSVHDLLEALNEEGEHDHSTGFQRFDLLVVFNMGRFCIHLLGIKATREFSKQPSKRNLQPEPKNTQVTKKDDDAIKRNPCDGSHYVNFYTVYLHFIIGLYTTGTFVCLHYFEFLHQMNIEFFFMVGLLVYTVLKTKDIFVLATDIMLQGIPQHYDRNIEKLLEQVKSLEGVEHISEVRYWSLNPDHLVIYLHIKIMSPNKKPRIEKEVKDILKNDFSEILIDITDENIIE